MLLTAHKLIKLRMEVELQNGTSKDYLDLNFLSSLSEYFFESGNKLEKATFLNLLFLFILLCFFIDLKIDFRMLGLSFENSKALSHVLVTIVSIKSTFLVYNFSTYIVQMWLIESVIDSIYADADKEILRARYLGLDFEKFLNFKFEFLQTGFLWKVLRYSSLFGICMVCFFSAVLYYWVISNIIIEMINNPILPKELSWVLALLSIFLQFMIILAAISFFIPHNVIQTQNSIDNN